MSAWRRRAIALLPAQRSRIERAPSPAALWNALYDLAVATCAQPSVAEDLLRAIFAYARDCNSSSDEAVIGAVWSCFHVRLLDDPLLRSWLPRLMDETDIRRLEPALSARLGAGPFAGFKEDFLHGLARAQAGTRIGALRAIKDDLLAVSSDDAKDSIRAAWTNVLGMLEASETCVGLEIFLDNIGDSGVRIPPAVGERLVKLCVDWDVEPRVRIER